MTQTLCIHKNPTSNHATGFIKYYEGGEFAFLALLPEEGMTVEEYVDTLTAEEYLSLYNNREYRDVIVRIPEFSYEYSTELKEPLSNMGMAGAFLPSADFTNMADTDTGELFISQVLHKTYIELDRPFVYAIIDTETGLPIFMGTVNTVE